MIIALGELETKKLIDDFIKIAQGHNEIHERNPVYGRLKHGHGWGIAYLKKDKWQIYKSRTPVYEDKKIEQFKKLKTRALVLHARKATIGDKSIANIQPLKYSSEQGEFIFAHNGSIYEDFKVNHKYLYGTSDTVNWFNNILNNLNNGNEISDIYSFHNYTSANFFLITPEKIIIGQNFKRDPKYFTMKYHKTDDMVIISSEVLGFGEWTTLQNKSFIEISR